MPRWIFFPLALILGIGLGLLYGWVVSPVQYVDVTPDALRIDFRTDYTIMVAEAYRFEQNPELASRRLAILGSEGPALLVGEAYDYARQSNYPAEDLTLIQDLALAMQTWQPAIGTGLP